MRAEQGSSHCTLFDGGAGVLAPSGLDAAAGIADAAAPAGTGGGSTAPSVDDDCHSVQAKLPSCIRHTMGQASVMVYSHVAGSLISRSVQP